MKTIKLIAIIAILALTSCEKDNIPDCGTIVAVTIVLNQPINGDEFYQIDYKNEYGEFRTVWQSLNLNYGKPGSPNQPIKKVIIGDYYCNQ